MSSEVEIIEDDYVVTAIEEYNRAKDSMCLLMWIKDKQGHVLDSSVHYRKSVHDVQSMAKVFLTNFRDKIHIRVVHDGLQRDLALALDVLDQLAQSECECTAKSMAQAALKAIRGRGFDEKPQEIHQSSE
jgi:hypothetical protein